MRENDKFRRQGKKIQHTYYKMKSPKEKIETRKQKKY